MDNTLELIINEKKITCSICGNDKFTKREGVLSSGKQAFFGHQWTDRKVMHHICTKCYNVITFANEY